jgi:CRISPR-associated protein (TIGR02710 family)
VNKIQTITLSPELKAVQEAWLSESNRAKTDEIYRTQFFPAFMPEFQQLPLHNAPYQFQKEEKKVLISMLGFSWEPVVLMMKWLQPEWMLLIGTKDSLKHRVADKSVMDWIHQNSGLELGKFSFITVDERDEVTIYQAIHTFLKTNDLSIAETVIDPTGGKKSMSAAAASAAFVMDIPMLYVDYAEYNEAARRPVIGTEFPRYISNPMSVLGYLEYEKIFSAFNRGDYGESESSARELASKLNVPREAELLHQIAMAYNLWAQFRFDKALKKLSEALAFMEEQDLRKEWKWAWEHREKMEKHQIFLEKLQLYRNDFFPPTLEDGLPIILNHLAATRKAIEEERASIAILLLYSALERFFDLFLRCEYGLADEKPDYSLLEGKLNREAFDKAGKALLGAVYQSRELAGPITFSVGFQLVKSLRHALIEDSQIQTIATMMQKRNKSPYEHGLSYLSLDNKELNKYYQTIKSIIQKAYSEYSNFDNLISEYTFPKFSQEI